MSAPACLTLLRITAPLLAAILATTVLAFGRSIGSFESELFLHPAHPRIPRCSCTSSTRR
jgi:ABC-type sulfate transport system permease component